MSGIAGIIRWDGAPAEPELMHAMTLQMSHRGPDGIRHWSEAGVALGHCMFRTTPESLLEQQPLANEDGSLVLVMDGRIDNWTELRADLLARGVHLRDPSDAELVLRAFELWGESCVQHIDGDFALAIWNRPLRTLFCARDRIGIRPFNYFTDGELFVFASETQAVLCAPGVPRNPNHGMVADFLAMSWTSRIETFWEGVVHLEPAHTMVVADGQCRTRRYWQPDLHARIRYRHDAQYVEHYRSLLDDTVRRQSRSQTPLAFEVSGGLDSSALFAVAERLRTAGALQAPSIHGYTLYFPGETAANELAYARAVGEHLGLSIREIEPSRPPLTWYEDSARERGDFPGYPNGSMSLGLRRAAAERGCRSLLVGIGGDEWLSGRRSHYLSEFFRLQWRELRKSFRKDVSTRGFTSTVIRLLRSGLGPMLPASMKKPLHAWLVVQSARKHHKLDVLAPASRALATARRKQFDSATGYRDATPAQQVLMEILNDPFSHWAHQSEERLAAMTGIELRLPFYSAQMVQFSFSVPDRLRVRGGVNKYLHRQALRGDLPPLVLARSDKADFMDTFRFYFPELLTALELGNVQAGACPLRAEAVYGLIAELRSGASFGGRAEWLAWSIFGCKDVHFTRRSLIYPN